MPANDLADPPRNYPGSPGGACVGMCAVAHALWCCPEVPGTLSPEACAARVVHSLVPGRDGRFANHPLPSHLRIDGEAIALRERRCLVKLAEIVQTALQPGGGVPKPPETVRRLHDSVRAEPTRLKTASALERAVDASGGRAVVILADFSDDLATMSGHAVIVSRDPNDRLSVWDPNARMDNNALGSGRPAPLELETDQAGELARLRFRITLPDGTDQARRFRFALPVTTVITADRLKRLPLN